MSVQFEQPNFWILFYSFTQTANNGLSASVGDRRFRGLWLCCCGSGTPRVSCCCFEITMYFHEDVFLICLVPLRPHVHGVHRVGVAGKKDLYEYWKGDIAQCLLQDVQGKGSVESCTDGFLVVNVASQEVRLEGRGNNFSILPAGRLRWTVVLLCTAATPPSRACRFCIRAACRHFSLGTVDCCRNHRLLKSKIVR